MLYFIDFADGERISRDDDGLEFASLRAACAAAVAALPGVAQEALHRTSAVAATMEAGERCLSAQVRDEAGRVRFRADFRLSIEWHAEQ